MALGIGVEFFAHMVHAFMEEQGHAQARADAALAGELVGLPLETPPALMHVNA